MARRDKRVRETWKKEGRDLKRSVATKWMGGPKVRRDRMERDSERGRGRGGAVLRTGGRDLRGEMCCETGVEISGQIPLPSSLLQLPDCQGVKVIGHIFPHPLA